MKSVSRLCARNMSNKNIFFVLLVIISAIHLLLYGQRHASTLQTFSCSLLPLGQWRLPLPPGKAKHTSVVFLKTHKTGSTTVQNILFRFAERHNLTVALPTTTCGHQFCYPHPFSAGYVHKNTMPPDILTSHTRLNVNEMRRLMPNDTRYITILREPVAMFESAFSYFVDCESFRRVPNRSIEKFLGQPLLYYRPNERYSMLARNTVTYDLGGDKDRPLGDMDYLWRFTRHLEDVFSLVLITEHFDESLVLLRHLLHWDPEDLVYLKLNVRAQQSRKRLRGVLAAKTRAWNWLDAALYDYFNASLWQQLEQLGPACLERELRLLREARDRVMVACFGTARPQMTPVGRIRNKALRPWQPPKITMVGYDLTGDAGGKKGSDIPKQGAAGISKDFCIKMIMAERPYSQLLLRTQPLPHGLGE